MSEFLRPLDVAKILGVTRTTVYSLIKTGEIPASKIGNNVLIKRETIDRLIAGEGKAK